MNNDQLFDKLKGVIVPTLTPLDDGECVDVESTNRLIDHLIAGGVHGVFLLGTTGEYIRLTDNEKDKYLETCAAKLNGQMLMSVNVSDTGTKRIIRNIRQAEKYNTDFVAVGIPPYFVINDVDEQYDLFAEIAGSTDLPVMIYNIPWCTGGYIKIECVEKLLKHKNIIGIKDSSGDLEYLKKIVTLTKGENFAIFVGHEGLMFEAFEIGAVGIISSSANVFPSEVVELFNSYASGDLAVKDRLYPLLNGLHSCKSKFADNIYGIYMLKYILQKMMICKANVTRPYYSCPQKDSNIEEFYSSVF